ncbi:unnamed protein product [Calypogeia fissa]
MAQLTESVRKELDERAAHGETVVQGGTGGKSLDAQERLAAGRKHGGEVRKAEMTHEDYVDMGKLGGEARSHQMSHEDYVKMGKKGGEARKNELRYEDSHPHGKEGWSDKLHAMKKNVLQHMHLRE